MSIFSRLGRTLFRSIKHLVEAGSSKVAAHAQGAGQQIRAAQQLQGALQGTVPSLCHGLFRGVLGQPTLQMSLIKGQTVLRLMKGFGPRAPMFAFLGFVYTNFTVKQASEVQLERDKYQQLQNWVQEGLTRKQEINQDSNPHTHSGLRLKDYQLGERLGQKSSNAAVYAAIRDDKEFAVKMLFNYHASSQSTTLYQEFVKEYAVLSTRHETSLAHLPDSQTHSWLPPHPNVVPILHSFVDNVPCLPDAQASYPAALPPRYLTGGLGRNRTLFLVMPRLSRTVREFVNTDPVNPEVASLLFTQLLEGISHCTTYEVAHRDLKTDNLLLDESYQQCPRLLITDFGCCLADQIWGLKLPFLTEETSRGGNMQLMAPEVATASAAEDGVIDYSKSDAWAAGAIAYELFGQTNPFDTLMNTSYTEDQLPFLIRAPPRVREVVSLLLRREPSERATADQAATMMHLILWAPDRWLESLNCRPGVCDVLKWLIGLCLRVLPPVGPQKSVMVERQLLSMFVLRTGVEDIMKALDIFHRVSRSSFPSTRRWEGKDYWGAPFSSALATGLGAHD